MKSITSRQNALVARCRAIARGTDRASILLEGTHLVAEALGAGVALEHLLVSSEARSRADVYAICDRAAGQGFEVVTVSAPVMAAVSPVRTPSGLLAIAARPRLEPARVYDGPSGVIVIVCDMQDPGNVGAIVRAAEASGADGVVAAGACADLFGWKALRGSMGSALRLPLATSPNIEEALADARAHQHRIVAAVPAGGIPLFQSRLTGRLALVIGAEGGGLPDLVVDNADEPVSVPMEEPVESLNAATTAAVILYEARRQREASSSTRS